MRLHAWVPDRTILTSSYQGACPSPGRSPFWPHLRSWGAGLRARSARTGRRRTPRDCSSLLTYCPVNTDRTKSWSPTAVAQRAFRPPRDRNTLSPSTLAPQRWSARKYSRTRSTTIGSLLQRSHSSHVNRAATGARVFTHITQRVEQPVCVYNSA